MKVFSLLNSKQKRWLKTYCSKISITLDIRKFEGVIYVLKSGSQWRKLTEIVKEILSVDMQCVKSNYGTSEFIPLEGRLVVERTISWLDYFRRLCRNYEQLLSTATSMVRMAFLMILIKHI